MTVELIHKDPINDNNAIKKIFKNVWEVQDNGNKQLTIKYHNHLCHNYKVEEIESIKIYKDA